MLARRLSTLGVQKVASPVDVGGTALADPDARTAAEQAQRAGVDTMVVGRVTGLGGKLSIDARLRDGGSGAPVGRRVTSLFPADSGRCALGRPPSSLTRFGATL